MSKKVVYKFNEVIYETYDEAEEAVYKSAETGYDAYLDMSNEKVIICGLPYSPSEVFKNTDPIAYRCYQGDYADFLMNDIEEVVVEQ